MTTDDVLHDVLRANGQRYVDANYRWPVVLDRYTAFLQRFTGSSGADGTAAQGNGLP